QALIGIERRQNEQDKRLDEVEKTTNDIKEVFSLNTLNWRKEVNRIINAISRSNGGTYSQTRRKSYADLELRARCNLKRRLDNMVKRAREAGARKREVNNLNYLDVIARDEKLVEIYLTIVKEMAIKYGIDNI